MHKKALSRPQLKRVCRIGSNHGVKVKTLDAYSPLHGPPKEIKRQMFSIKHQYGSINSPTVTCVPGKAEPGNASPVVYK